MLEEVTEVKDSDSSSASEYVIVEEEDKEKVVHSEWANIEDLTWEDASWTDIVTFICVVTTAAASWNVFWPLYGFTCWWSVCGGADYANERITEECEKKRLRNKIEQQ